MAGTGTPSVPGLRAPGFPGAGVLTPGILRTGVRRAGVGTHRAPAAETTAGSPASSRTASAIPATSSILRGKALVTGVIPGAGSGTGSQQDRA
jgi:hypothetical protein